MDTARTRRTNTPQDTFRAFAHWLYYGTIDKDVCKSNNALRVESATYDWLIRSGVLGDMLLAVGFKNAIIDGIVLHVKTLGQPSLQASSPSNIDPTLLALDNTAANHTQQTPRPQCRYHPTPNLPPASNRKPRNVGRVVTPGSIFD